MDICRFLPLPIWGLYKWSFYKHWWLSGKEYLPMQKWVQYLGQVDHLEKEMATHFSILAWEIPLTEEPGGLQYKGSQKNWIQLSD